MLMLGVCFTMLFSFSGVVYAQDVEAESIIVGDLGDSFTVGYLKDGNGVDMVAIMGPSLFDVTDRIYVRPFARAALDAWFGDWLNKSNPAGSSNYGAGIVLDWNVVRYEGYAFNLYAGQDYEIDEDTNGSHDINTIYGASITVPFSF